MECIVTNESDVTIIAMQGKLDSFSSKSFEEKLLGLIAAGSKKVLLDCAGLEYVSSAGLRIFYLAASKLETTGGKIVFCAVHPVIKRVFDIVDLSSEFLILSNREEALRQF
jgi:anti-anti-sigma factor